MVKLGVNIDHVATVRQARRINEPDPVYAVTLAELGGADGITIHLREDRRHIQDRDVYLIKEVAKTRLNLEMACVNEIIEVALDVKPDMCTLVPEKREEVTTEGGLDVIQNFDLVASTVKRLSEAGIEVSIFIDPDTKQIDKAFETGAKVIELHTGRYADTKGEEQKMELKRLKVAAAHAIDKGFKVSAGHGLNYINVRDIVKIPMLYEVNIGHSIIGRSIFVGLKEAVSQMKSIINSTLKC
ncbi:pyridoxine 5'-phosphate synthase [Deferribacterales bacterium Es71-Z0220]|uniref:pyridoxine 5'-phosphate synthase n=1 Tax=Deferrivibrio essentukiensis TaxID=2880922 RepID=UPI001F60AFBD|nr:pyridoxine 5'-phosphate synthase [Deferrivibrio essentukiensis]MCB4204506.1 pyridoxine 5'-phosphate synthase [Deferrivibrio essentukiensis]